jgi:hypothetical protein
MRIEIDNPRIQEIIHNIAEDLDLAQSMSDMHNCFMLWI